MRSPRPRIRTLLAAAIGVLISLFGLAAPAHAVVGACGSGELTFVNLPGCTATGMVRASGELLTRAQLLSNLAAYEANGFTREFIEQSPVISITVAPGIDWVGCHPDNGADGLCLTDPGEGLVESSLDNLFAEGVQITVIGTPDRWIALMCGNFHPVETPNADVAKVDFGVVDLPQRIDADTDVQLTVRAQVVNNGPAAMTTATDLIQLAGPADCTITPSQLQRDLQLPLGEPVTFDVSVIVRCTEPSNHAFTMVDTLVTQSGRLDPDMSNNTRTVGFSVAVFDSSDLAVRDATLTCAGQTQVGASFDCTGSALVTNLGPYGATQTTSSLVLAAPEDCTVTVGPGSKLDDVALAVGAPTPINQTWSITCSKRSFHPMSLTASAQVTHLHVEDRVPANNVATATAVTPVFEAVDLEATLDHLACSEREANRTVSGCTATITITNNGPADAVVTQTDVTFLGEADCVVAPSPTQSTTRTLGVGQSWTFTTSVQLTCSASRRHVVRVHAALHNAPSDPHAVDSDVVSGLWVPSDVKPRSYPSAVNLGKEGLLPFALLGSAQFDPLTQVRTSTLHIGRTGTESGTVRCAPGGEDVNGDGYLDLVCQVDTPTADIRCDTTWLEIVGTLTDGTPFWSQDEIKVTGCRR